MSIASEINRINNNIAAAYDACEDKGATMPQTQNSANLANTIGSIPQGGGAGVEDVQMLYDHPDMPNINKATSNDVLYRVFDQKNGDVLGWAIFCGNLENNGVTVAQFRLWYNAGLMYRTGTVNNGDVTWSNVWQNFVPASRTIAGLDLQSNISAASLTQALGGIGGGVTLINEDTVSESINWLGVIPDTYAGNTGEIGEIALYYDYASLWVLIDVDSSNEYYEWERQPASSDFLSYYSKSETNALLSGKAPVIVTETEVTYDSDLLEIEQQTADGSISVQAQQGTLGYPYLLQCEGKSLLPDFGAIRVEFDTPDGQHNVVGGGTYLSVNGMTIEIINKNTFRFNGTCSINSAVYFSTGASSLFSFTEDITQGQDVTYGWLQSGSADNYGAVSVNYAFTGLSSQTKTCSVESLKEYEINFGTACSGMRLSISIPVGLAFEDFMITPFVFSSTDVNVIENPVYTDGSLDISSYVSSYEKLSTYPNKHKVVYRADTKKYIDTRIGDISTLSFEVVQTKPVTDIKTNVIYLIPSSDASTGNIYEEWIYANNAWEMIGSTQIDLSNYYTKTQVDNLIPNISGKEDTSNKVTSLSSSSSDTQYPSAKCVYDATKNVEKTTNKITSFTNSANRTNTKYPSAKLVYDQLQLKANRTDVAIKKHLETYEVVVDGERRLYFRDTQYNTRLKFFEIINQFGLSNIEFVIRPEPYVINDRSTYGFKAKAEIYSSSGELFFLLATYEGGFLRDWFLDTTMFKDDNDLIYFYLGDEYDFSDILVPPNVE